MIDNAVTATIMLAILLLIMVGFFLMFLGNLIGVVFIGAAVLWITYGWTEHGFVKEEKGDGKIPIVGFLTFNGTPIRSLDGKCITVDCSVILAPFLGISSIKINMTPVTIDTTVNVLSQEKDNDGTQIQYPLSIFSTIAPDENHLDWFTAYGNGKFDKITKDFNGIAIVEAEIIASKLSVFQVAASGNIVSHELEKALQEKVKAKEMGIKIKFVKAECKIPDNIANAAEEVFKAKYESTARVNTAIGLDEVTRTILNEANKPENRGDGPKMSYEEARRHAITTSLLEEEELHRNQFEIIAPATLTSLTILGGVGGAGNGRGQQDQDQNKQSKKKGKK